MQVRFWGVRGSIPTPGPETVRYGGNTTCVELVLESGAHLILDAGTGIRRLGRSLVASGVRPIHAHLFLTHSHWDHTHGFPFFAPAFIQGTRLDVHGCQDGETALQDILSRQMTQQYFPVDFSELRAEITFNTCTSACARIDPAAVSRLRLNHPGTGCGYRFEAEGKVVVFLTDNELVPGGPQANGPALEFARDADLLIHDAQYTPEDIDAHRGWGHSCYVDVVDLALLAGVRHLVLFHHDPERSDEQVDDIQAAARAQVDAIGGNLRCDAAAEGMVLEI